MQSFELQVYKKGKWEFDSYFDDRETALFEAERLHDSDRYHGIRVLKEDYRDNSETSDCTVIFSRLRKVETSDPRTQATREAYRMAVREVAKPGRAQPGKARSSSRRGRKNKARAKTARRPASRSGNHTSVYTLMIVAVLIVVAGVGAMVGLRYMAHMM